MQAQARLWLHLPAPAVEVAKSARAVAYMLTTPKFQGPTYDGFSRRADKLIKRGYGSPRTLVTELTPQDARSGCAELRALGAGAGGEGEGGGGGGGVLTTQQLDASEQEACYPSWLVVVLVPWMTVYEQAPPPS